MEPEPSRIHILDQSFVYIPQSPPPSSASSDQKTAILSSAKPQEEASAQELDKRPPKAVAATQKLGQDLSSVPELMFNASSPSSPQHRQSRVSQFVAGHAYTPVDGLAKGVAAFGQGIYKGVTGVFSEPVKGARKEGGLGFLKGLGRGVAGLVFKPLSGAVILTSKTIEGIVNTPDTIAHGITKHFSVPLHISLARAAQNEQLHITTKCFQFIMNHGLEKEGLFRISGKQIVVEDLRTRIDKGEDVLLCEPEVGPHEVASLLKLYLRLLPDPLVPFEYYEPLVALMGEFDDPRYDETESLAGLRAILAQMPIENQYVLLQLLVMLSEVAAHSDVNKMTVDNITVVVSPSVIRCPEVKSESLDAQAKILVELRAVHHGFKQLIVHWESLFDTEALLAPESL